jgi:hypothetical protein
MESAHRTTVVPAVRGNAGAIGKMNLARVEAGSNRAKGAVRIEYHYRPGRRWSETQLQNYVREFREVAADCFDTPPDYQCLTGCRKALCDNVITVARRADGRMVGFSSAVLLPVPEVGDVLHLGLTCVAAVARGSALTHKLNSTLVVRYMLRRLLLGRVWVTNIACVLSSLGNVALNFDEVYPSPFVDTPSRRHRLIAETFDRFYRAKAFVRSDASFDAEHFVFRGSGRDTAFQKSADDRRYYHRDDGLNHYYRRLLHFDDGDEVIQVGSADVLSAVRYLFRRRARGKARYALPVAVESSTS